MFVKICGLTDEVAVSTAVAAGADAIGFVFAQSPRQVSPLRAAQLCTGLPDRVTRIAVMQHPSADELAAVLDQFAPDWLQTDASDFAEISLPDTCAPLPVYRNGALPRALLEAETAGDDDATPRLLFEGTASGSGATADWDEARKLAQRSRLILAGGLRADNVADAIRAVRPWGVDVSSGVESQRGVKDPTKINDFIAHVRALET